MKRVLLVYRGELADVVSLYWLKHRMKMDVFTYTPQVGGQDIAPESVGEDAMRMGVESAYFGELNEKFYRYILTNSIRGGIRGRNGSFLINALTRPVIAREMADIAEENSCRFIAFSADPYSLDQLRYNSLFSAISPGVRVISTQAEWPFRTWKDLVKFAREHDLPNADDKKQKEIKIEKNIWGSRVKCGRIEDLWKESPDELFSEIAKVEAASEKARNIEIEFAQGIPISLNGKEMTGVELVKELNIIGGKQGIGRMDIIEEELLGIKSRIIQEAPAAQILFTAHKALEDITLSAEILEMQEAMTRKLTKIVYEGAWFTDLREAICGFFAKTQNNVTGAIKVKLYKGNCIVTRRKADTPLYNRELITKDHTGSFPVDDIEKFLNVWKQSKSPEQEISTKQL